MNFDKSSLPERLSGEKYVALAKQLSENLGVNSTDDEPEFAINAATMYFEGDGYAVDKVQLSYLVNAHLSALKEEEAIRQGEVSRLRMMRARVKRLREQRIRIGQREHIDLSWWDQEIAATEEQVIDLDKNLIEFAEAWHEDVWSAMRKAADLYRKMEKFDVASKDQDMLIHERARCNQELIRLHNAGTSRWGAEPAFEWMVEIKERLRVDYKS